MGDFNFREDFYVDTPMWRACAGRDPVITPSEPSHTIIYMITALFLHLKRFYSWYH